ncbi:MAG: MoaD family protein [Halobacteriota archaeon]|nr:MoaD family protein [Halobacteriota archaeon]
MVKVKVFSTLRSITKESEFEIEAESIKELVKKCSKLYGKEFKDQLRHSSIVLNGRDIRHIRGSIKLGSEDEVSLLPPAGGG